MSDNGERENEKENENGNEKEKDKGNENGNEKEEWDVPIAVVRERACVL